MKAIILAAGYGTRFLPITKTIPKEMLPLIDIPTIDFIIDELINSGIKDILVLTSRRKKSLEDYFDKEIELENFLRERNDKDNIKKIMSKDINIYFLRQKEMKGTGHAILQCKEFIGESPFIVVYPDDIVFSSVPLTKQLIDIYDRTKGNVLAVEEIDGDVSRYGVIDYIKEGDLLKIKKIIEKPKKGTEPSKMISIGRYIYIPDILPILEKEYKAHTKGEFYQIGAVNKLADENKVFACKYKGERIDVGEKLGYIEGIIRYGLKREDLKEDIKRMLRKYVLEED